MRLLFYTPALVFLGAVSPEKEVAKFHGTWSVVGYHNHGTVLPKEKLKQLKVIFKDDDVVIRLGKEHEDKFKFAIDPGTNPKSISFIPEQGQAMHGIYEFKDGKLTIGLHLKGVRPLDEIGDTPFSHLTRGLGFMAKITPSEFPRQPRAFFSLLVLTQNK